MDEAASDALQLGPGHRARIELDAAFAAPEGNLHEGALPGHHRGGRLEIIEGDALVIANAAFEWSQDVRMLNAIAFEKSHLSVVNANGKVDDELVLGLAQNEANVVGQLDERGGPVEILLDDFEKLVSGPRCRAGRRGTSGANDDGGG